jgi:hypothetical protein
MPLDTLSSFRRSNLNQKKFSERNITASADTYIDTHRSKKSDIMGFDTSTFPMIRPEKEELYQSQNPILKGL